MKRQLSKLDTTGLSASGIWVRRQRPMPGLADEAVCLHHVMQTWDLHDRIRLDHVNSAYAEVSGLDWPPTWAYLIEVVGQKVPGDGLVLNHPLSQVADDEPVRLLAVVHPEELRVMGALVETRTQRRTVWLALTPR